MVNIRKYPPKIDATVWNDLVKYGIINSGSSFPTDKQTTQIFYRTDLNGYFVYNGTSWVAIDALTISVGDNFPSNPQPNRIYYNKGLGKLCLYIDGVWVPIVTISIDSGLNFPASPVMNQLFFKTDLQQLCLYVGHWMPIASIAVMPTSYTIYVRDNLYYAINGTTQGADFINPDFSVVLQSCIDNMSRGKIDIREGVYIGSTGIINPKGINIKCSGRNATTLKLSGTIGLLCYNSDGVKFSDFSFDMSNLTYGIIFVGVSRSITDNVNFTNMHSGSCAIGYFGYSYENDPLNAWSKNKNNVLTNFSIDTVNIETKQDYLGIIISDGFKNAIRDGRILNCGVGIQFQSLCDWCEANTIENIEIFNPIHAGIRGTYRNAINPDDIIFVNPNVFPTASFSNTRMKDITIDLCTLNSKGLDFSESEIVDKTTVIENHDGDRYVYRPEGLYRSAMDNIIIWINKDKYGGVEENPIEINGVIHNLGTIAVDFGMPMDRTKIDGLFLESFCYDEIDPPVTVPKPTGIIIRKLPELNQTDGSFLTTDKSGIKTWIQPPVFYGPIEPKFIDLNINPTTEQMTFYGNEVQSTKFVVSTIKTFDNVSGPITGEVYGDPPVTPRMVVDQLDDEIWKLVKLVKKDSPEYGEYIDWEKQIHYNLTQKELRLSYNQKIRMFGDDDVTKAGDSDIDGDNDAAKITLDGKTGKIKCESLNITGLMDDLKIKDGKSLFLYSDAAGDVLETKINGAAHPSGWSIFNSDIWVNNGRNIILFNDNGNTEKIKLSGLDGGITGDALYIGGLNAKVGQNSIIINNNLRPNNISIGNETHKVNEIYVGTLYADNITAEGATIDLTSIESSIVPVDSLVYNIGSEDKLWSDIYTNKILTNHIYPIVNNNIIIHGNIIPIGGTFNIGSSADSWSKMYTSDLYIDKIYPKTTEYYTSYADIIPEMNSGSPIRKIGDYSNYWLSIMTQDSYQQTLRPISGSEITVHGNIIPNELHSFGSETKPWHGFFEDVLIKNRLRVNDYIEVKAALENYIKIGTQYLDSNPVFVVYNEQGFVNTRVGDLQANGFISTRTDATKSTGGGAIFFDHGLTHVYDPPRIVLLDSYKALVNNLDTTGDTYNFDTLFITGYTEAKYVTINEPLNEEYANVYDLLTNVALKSLYAYDFIDVHQDGWTGIQIKSKDGDETFAKFIGSGSPDFAAKVNFPNDGTFLISNIGDEERLKLDDKGNLTLTPVAGVIDENGKIDSSMIYANGAEFNNLLTLSCAPLYLTKQEIINSIYGWNIDGTWANPTIDVSDSRLVFHDAIYDHYVNLYMILAESDGELPTPLLTTDQGLLVKKDVGCGGMFTTQQGAILMGHGLNGPNDPPRINLTDTGFDTLCITSGTGLPKGLAINIDTINDYLANLKVKDITVSGDILPTGVSAKDIGSMTHTWNNIFSTTLNLRNVMQNNHVSIGSDSTGLILVVDSSSTTGGIVPASGKTLALGKSDQKWHSIYGNNIYVDNLGSPTDGIITVQSSIDFNNETVTNFSFDSLTIPINRLSIGEDDQVLSIVDGVPTWTNPEATLTKHAFSHENEGDDRLELDATQIVTGTFNKDRVPWTSIPETGIKIGDACTLYENSSNKLITDVDFISKGLIHSNMSNGGLQINSSTGAFRGAYLANDTEIIMKVKSGGKYYWKDDVSSTPRMVLDENSKLSVENQIYVPYLQLYDFAPPWRYGDPDPSPVGAPRLHFHDETQQYDLNIFLTRMVDPLTMNLDPSQYIYNPILWIEHGIFVKKDIAAFGALMSTSPVGGTGGGAIMLGKGFDEPESPPMILLTQNHGNMHNGNRTLYLLTNKDDISSYANFICGNVKLSEIASVGTNICVANNIVPKASPTQLNLNIGSEDSPFDYGYFNNVKVDEITVATGIYANDYYDKLGTDNAIFHGSADKLNNEEASYYLDLTNATGVLALSKLAAGTDGYVLRVVNGVPTWTVFPEAGTYTVSSPLSISDNNISLNQSLLSITKSRITDFEHEHPKADITDFEHEHSGSDITSKLDTDNIPWDSVPANLLNIGGIPVTKHSVATQDYLRINGGLNVTADFNASQITTNKIYIGGGNIYWQHITTSGGEILSLESDQYWIFGSDVQVGGGLSVTGDLGVNVIKSKDGHSTIGGYGDSERFGGQFNTINTYALQATVGVYSNHYYDESRGDTAVFHGNAVSATTATVATTAYKIRIGRPASPSNGDIWME